MCLDFSEVIVRPFIHGKCITEIWFKCIGPCVLVWSVDDGVKVEYMTGPLCMKAGVTNSEVLLWCPVVGFGIMCGDVTVGYLTSSWEVNLTGAVMYEARTRAAPRRSGTPCLVRLMTWWDAASSCLDRKTSGGTDREKCNRLHSMRCLAGGGSGDLARQLGSWFRIPLIDVFMLL
jgi:hypothetical protein